MKLEKKIVSQIKKIYEDKQSEKFRLYINGAKGFGNYFAGKLKEFAWKRLIKKETIKEHAGKLEILSHYPCLLVEHPVSRFSFHYIILSQAVIPTLLVAIT